MIQRLMDVGIRRSGVHKGGLPQKYVLDDVGRRLLIDRYDGRKATLDDLMHRHFTPRGIPRQKVKHWASALGLARQKEPAWTPDEIAYLEKYLHKSSLRDIGKHLGRTAVAVRLKAKRLGINKCHQEGYTMRGLMEGLGITNHHRVLLWIDKGWLKGHKRQTERTHDVWYFSDAAIRKFVKEHPNEIDPRRADWLWLVDVLVGLGSLTEEREVSA